MSRLAEKIRNTQPWCAALLRAPQLVLEVVDDPEGIPSVRNPGYSDATEPMMMPWKPGFVVQFPGVTIERYYDSDIDSIVEGDGIEESMVVTARLRRERDVELEVWYCRGPDDYRLGKSVLREGTPLRESLYRPDQDTLKRRPEGRSEAWFYEFVQTRVGMAMAMLASTLRLLQCKNVRLIEQKNSPKKRSKGKMKRQVESYWVLDIPGSPRYWDKSSTGHTGIHSRLHVVRGHFKTYTEEAPLFGRVTGTIWVPCHARGDAQLGLIEKDYNLVGDQGGRDVA